MFVNSQMGGMTFGFPDVCKTPTPAGPVPVPYPNITTHSTAVPNQFKYLIQGMPAHNLATTTPMSNGDNAGVALGVVSNVVMGPMRHTMGSTNLFIGGPPATKMLNPTGHNGAAMNVPGTAIAPSQVKIMSLR